MPDSPVLSLPPKERLILELVIAHGELFGLQLIDASGGRLKRGTIYVTLGRMEKKGLLRSTQEPLPSNAIGLPRRLYRATPLGERALRAWNAFSQELAWTEPS